MIMSMDFRVQLSGTPSHHMSAISCIKVTLGTVTAVALLAIGTIGILHCQGILRSDHLTWLKPICIPITSLVVGTLLGIGVARHAHHKRQSTTLQPMTFFQSGTSYAGHLTLERSGNSGQIDYHANHRTVRITYTLDEYNDAQTTLKLAYRSNPHMTLYAHLPVEEGASIQTTVLAWLQNPGISSENLRQAILQALTSSN